MVLLNKILVDFQLDIDLAITLMYYFAYILIATTNNLASNVSGDIFKK